VGSVTPGIVRLIDAVGSVLADGDGSPEHWGGPAVAADLGAALRQALDDPRLLPDEIGARAPRLGFATCLLHVSPNFSLFSSVTAPGALPPVHDHGSWGLVGLYRGIEEEIRFDHPSATEGPAPGLVEVGRDTFRQGDVMTVGPPPSDVHQVLNRGGETSVTVHLFRHDLVAQGFAVYEVPGYRRIPTGPIAYDAVLTTDA